MDEIEVFDNSILGLKATQPTLSFYNTGKITFNPTASDIINLKIDDRITFIKHNNKWYVFKDNKGFIVREEIKGRIRKKGGYNLKVVQCKYLYDRIQKELNFDRITVKMRIFENKSNIDKYKDCYPLEILNK